MSLHKTRIKKHFTLVHLENDFFRILYISKQVITANDTNIMVHGTPFTKLQKLSTTKGIGTKGIGCKKYRQQRYRIPLACLAAALGPLACLDAALGP